jgi:drug/metabolite transporter (DMT)-like permease
MIMEWYLFAFLAPAFWALNNVFIKFLITNKFKSYFPTIATITSFDAIFAVAISLLTPINLIFPYSLIGLIAGLLPLTAFWFYSNAILVEEVSRIVTLFQLVPVFVAVLSAAFLGEVIGAQRYFAIGLIVLASTLISYRRSAEKTISNVLRFMIPFALIIAIYTIVDKSLLSYLDFWSLFFCNIIGTLLGVLVMLSRSSLRKNFFSTFNSLGKKSVLVTFVGEGMYVAGTICSLIALSLVDAPVASAFFGLQPFYVFFYILFLSLFLPNILKEDMKKPVIALKIAAIALMFLGTWLII